MRLLKARLIYSWCVCVYLTVGIVIQMYFKWIYCLLRAFLNALLCFRTQRYLVSWMKRCWKNDCDRHTLVHKYTNKRGCAFVNPGQASTHMQMYSAHQIACTQSYWTWVKTARRGCFQCMVYIDCSVLLLLITPPPGSNSLSPIQRAAKTL